MTPFIFPGTMKRHASLLFLSLFAALLCGHRPLNPPPSLSGSFLGFSLMPGPNNGLVSFAIVTPLPNGQQDCQFISRNDFIRMASGVVHNEVNPTAENLFTKYAVEECGMYRDSVFNRTNFTCGVLDQLWKLRYHQGPYGGADSLGWTGATVPSTNQMNTLKGYGITNLDDFFYGENAFKLLHDMQSYAWQSRYKSG
ncbi:MAG TPA: hypothetical protein VGO45_06470 [Bacteroidia bacterium]|nr:hypothetical protein [Bacteroidia bacterium]